MLCAEYECVRLPSNRHRSLLACIFLSIVCYVWRMRDLGRIICRPNTTCSSLLLISISFVHFFPMTHSSRANIRDSMRKHLRWGKSIVTRNWTGTKPKLLSKREMTTIDHLVTVSNGLEKCGVDTHNWQGFRIFLQIIERKLIDLKTGWIVDAQLCCIDLPRFYTTVWIIMKN